MYLYIEEFTLIIIMAFVTAKRMYVYLPIVYIYIYAHVSDDLPICLQHECTLSICCSAGDNVLDLMLAEPRAISRF